MRPASPLPATADRATSCASAILRAVGVAFCPSLASFAAGAGAAGAGGGGRSAFGGRSRSRGAGVDHRQHVADLHVGSFRVLDRRQHAGLLGADLEVDLLGLELDDGLAGGDGLALALQPARDARFDDRLTELGNDDVDGHGVLYACAPASAQRASTGTFSAKAWSAMMR